MRLVNIELLREPVNWVIVALMLAIAAFGLHLLLAEGPTHAGHVPDGGVE